MTLGEALDWAHKELVRAGVEAPKRDAVALMAEATGYSLAQVATRMEDDLSVEQLDLFDGYVARRTAREPVSHITCRRAFWRHTFFVSRDVLDPRPDTETLVELALSEPFAELLDLGTGTGCISISLLAERPETTGIATDVSAAALAVAGRNAKCIGVADRLHFELSDWFEGVGGTHDLIVSNPPYISEDIYETLSPEVHHEPKIALTPGGDGLGAYRVIARDAPGHLKPGGRLLVEIGFDQAVAVSDLFAQAGLEDVTVHPDLNGKDRVISARARAK